MNLTDYKVKTITYPYGEYRLGTMVPIIDEGSFYRIDGTHIFDKFKIISTSLDGEKMIIEMTDKTAVLEVEHV